MADLVVPSLGESITEAVVGKWLVEIGEHVGADDPVLDLETDKITVQVPAPCAGALTEQKFEEGDTVRVGDVVGALDPNAEGTKPEQAAKTTEADGEPEAEAPTNKAASAPKEPAEESKGSKAAPGGSQTELEPLERDPSGRVLSPAQRRAIRDGKAEAPRSATSNRPVTASQFGETPEDVIPMSPLRRRIAERLVQAQQSSASLTTFNEVDMTAIIAARKAFKEDFLDAHGVKLGFMSFAVKAAVEGLKLYPGVNAEVRDSAIVYKKFYDLGIAVGTERGLVVPVIRSCDHLSFAQVEQSIIDMAKKARSNKLVLDDLKGGTFTITNGGIYGSMMSTPLLNFPQTGILGLHNIVKRPMAMEDGSIEVRPMMYLALTYDHRVVDGQEAVQFLVAVKERMENPQRLLYGV